MIMSSDTQDNFNFLSLNNTLDNVLKFASENEYIHPPLAQEALHDFYIHMKDLFILSEQLKVFPSCVKKQTLESAAILYQPTSRYLVTLFMSSPSPKQAKGWFDYQKEFKAREQYQHEIMLLMSWHIHFFDELVSLCPPLLIPYPQQQSAIDTNAEGLNSELSNHSSQSSSSEQSYQAIQNFEL